jgi:hypothetical protein
MQQVASADASQCEACLRQSGARERTVAEGVSRLPRDVIVLAIRAGSPLHQHRQHLATMQLSQLESVNVSDQIQLRWLMPGNLTGSTAAFGAELHLSIALLRVRHLAALLFGHFTI